MDRIVFDSNYLKKSDYVVNWKQLNEHLGDMTTAEVLDVIDSCCSQSTTSKGLSTYLKLSQISGDFIVSGSR